VRGVSRHGGVVITERGSVPGPGAAGSDLHH
jgi:hypothetical protein